jgi:murein L,D-transpeptidase YcbB/YkuD
VRGQWTDRGRKRRAVGLLGPLLLMAAACLVLALPAEAADAIAAQLRNAYASPPDTAAPASDNSIETLVRTFYERRDFAPAWTRRSRIEALLSQLRGLSDDGIDPDVYPLAALDRGPIGPDSAAVARYDALATHWYLQAIADLHRGKVDPLRLSKDWRIGRPALDARLLDFVDRAVDDDAIAAAFERARPQHPLYATLRKALHDLRQSAGQNRWVPLPEGPTLKPGMIDPRVPLLRQRLAEEGYPDGSPPSAAESQEFDPALAEALRRYQADQNLTADGALGHSTLAALNLTVAQRIAKLRVNLERARWLLSELRDDLVLVDVAGFRISLFRGSAVVWRSRVQVGRPLRRTPMLRSEIRYLTLNPQWTVPPTILRKDILPKLRKDPRYLQREHLHVLDAQGNEIPADQVDWQHPQGITLRQDPGANGALGRVAFRFPNPFSIYLHDTPHRELFGKVQRAFSSGCIRVEHAQELAVLLLDDPQHWSAADFERTVADNKTRTVYRRKPMPILIAYWTLGLDKDGHLYYKPDLYGFDAPTLAALDTPYPAGAAP